MMPEALEKVLPAAIFTGGVSCFDDFSITGGYLLAKSSGKSPL
jgi:hypothetical protein